jgi:tRNA (guanine-N7-)-methyltransferase
MKNLTWPHRAFAEREPLYEPKAFYLPERFSHHVDWGVLDWCRLFSKENPIALELCSGNGEWIVEKAKGDSTVNWLAVEKKYTRVNRTWRRIYREKVENVAVVQGDARILIRHYIPKESISNIFVNFPDPWPKGRHAKHRLMQSPFLKDLGAVGCKGALLTCITDDLTYACQMKEQVLCSGVWHICPLDAKFDLQDYGSSYFGRLWQSKGRTLYPLHCEKRG